ncbi:MAG TPA: hypothetical protein VIE43_10400 [Thermoanaerobaculia bacterium]|nr:hypothetical protein [Thermoanaerobaculia bacterium]
MRHDPTDDELLRSYLLGELPEEEAERLEQRLLAEDDLFELSEALEADLLAACDRGELGAAEAERVLRRLAASPSGKERLALARALNALAGNSPAAVLPFRRSSAAPSRSTFRWAALAAGVLLATGISWIAAEHFRHGGESAPWIPQERSAPASPVAPTEAQILTPPPASMPKPVLSVFPLALTSTRGAEAPEKLRIPPGAQVELQISVEGMEELKSFQIEVRNRKAETVWDGAIEPRTLQGGVRALVIDLPGDRLPPGAYEIEARGLAPGREPEDLSPLDIEVVKDGKR